jgi:hypothetical protein
VVGAAAAYKAKAGLFQEAADAYKTLVDSGTLEADKRLGAMASLVIAT